MQIRVKPSTLDAWLGRASQFAGLAGLLLATACAPATPEYPTSRPLSLVSVPAGTHAADELDARPLPVETVPPRFPHELLPHLPGSEVRPVMVVDPTGEVIQAFIEFSTDPALDSYVLEAALQWRFEPATHEGEPVAFWIVVPFAYPKEAAPPR